jgi:hypothetical protein
MTRDSGASLSFELSEPVSPDRSGQESAWANPRRLFNYDGGLRGQRWDEESLLRGAGSVRCDLSFGERCQGSCCSDDRNRRVLWENPLVAGGNSGRPMSFAKLAKEKWTWKSVLRMFSKVVISVANKNSKYLWEKDSR